jgi:DNA-binding response OmpR family regulator
MLLTGCDDPVDVVRGSELRANDYVAKPVNQNVPLAHTHRLLAHNRSLLRRGIRVPRGEFGFPE